jgi:hypothetical protein
MLHLGGARGALPVLGDYAEDPGVELLLEELDVVYGVVCA